MELCCVAVVETIGGLTSQRILSMHENDRIAFEGAALSQPLIEWNGLLVVPRWRFINEGCAGVDNRCRHIVLIGYNRLATNRTLNG